MECYFIGIGGIGMSALASLALEKGYKVFGSDSTFNDRCKELQEKGAVITTGSAPRLLQSKMQVIFSSAITEEHPEKIRAKDLSLSIFHRSEFLSHLMGEKEQIVVTGTHGKTTTTSIAAFLFEQLGKDPSYALGGLLLPEQKNARLGDSSYFIVEGDESDGSFLSTSPKYGIITSLEMDHIDQWESKEELMAAFATFIGNSKNVIWNYDDPLLQKLQPKGISVGFSKQADLHIEWWEQRGDSILFSFSFRGKQYTHWTLPLIGRHNLLNAALVLALALDCNLENVKDALSHFKGVSRRLEKKERIMGVDLFDDYAHHPTEVKAAIKALRTAFPERRIIAVFQPHRASRFHHFWDDFMRSFDDADQVIVTDLFLAGEEPMPGITGKDFAQQLQAVYVEKNEMVERLIPTLRPFDILLFMGAGDITEIAGRVHSHLHKIKPLQLGILFGGESEEHAISLQSAEHIYQSFSRELFTIDRFIIDNDGKWSIKGEKAEPFTAKHLTHLQKMDLIFPVLHGPRGEDGMIQGFLETLHLPFIGCDYRSSAIAMQKAWAKAVVKELGIGVAPFYFFSKPTWQEERESILEEITERLSFPLWVKATHLGSSIGVYRCEELTSLQEAIEKCFSLDHSVIVEEEVKGRQIEFALSGNDRVEIPDPGEILAEGEFYDFERKYGENAVVATPFVRIPSEWKRKGKKLAKMIYRALECSSLARIDFFLDSYGNFTFNEINPIPGCRPESIYPMIWQQMKGSFSDHLNDLVIAALHRWEKRALR